jgi:hypothetical protein
MILALSIYDDIYDDLGIEKVMFEKNRKYYKAKTPLNQLIKRGLLYPEPGSNRHGNESTGV